MAYKTEIQVKVDGLAQVKKLEETLTRVNALQTRISKRATSKFVNIGRLGSETKALTSFNRELERNIALRERSQKLRPSGGGGAGGGVSGRPGGGVNRLESLALGAGFPLLFGGGAGQVLGGIAGSFVGTGFGGQILGSAIGGGVEQFLGSIADLGNALSATTPDLGVLTEALGGVNNEVGERIRLIEELEGETAALSAAQKELANLIGSDGVSSLKEYGGDVSAIGSEFSRFFTIMQANVAELINSSGILKAVIEQVGRATLFAQAERGKEQDPELALLFAQRRNVEAAATPEGFAGIFGPDPIKALQMTEEIEERIIQRQIKLNALKNVGTQQQLEELRAKKQALDLQKETDKKAREAHALRVTDLRVQQSGIQTQINQLANEEKIFQIRQQTAAATVELERARFDAQLSTLQLQEAGLQRELEGLQKKEYNTQRQLELIDQIAENRIKQAEIENQVAKLQNAQGIAQAEIAQQQIQFEVQRIKLQIEMVKLKAQEIKDDEQRAAKIREINATERQTLALAKEMVSSGNKRLETAREIARQKDIVADNILRGKLESIEAERVEARRAANAEQFARATGKAADEAARLNSNTSRGGGGSGGGGLGSKTTQTMSTSLPIDPDVRKAVIERAGPFGYRSVAELIGKLEEAQKLKNARTAKTAQMSRPSSSSFASSSSYASRSSFSGGGGTASVNVKTGPVMQVDNKRYVSMEDFESGLREVARSTAQTSRSYGSRRFGGIG